MFAPVQWNDSLHVINFFVMDPFQVTAVAQQNQGEVPEPQDMKVAEVLFDAADANAIEEVNLAYENVKEVDGLDVSKEGTQLAVDLLRPDDGA